MLNWVLALLIKDKRLTIKEAEALSHVLTRSIHPTDVKEAVKIVEEILKDPSKAMEEKT